MLHQVRAALARARQLFRRRAYFAAEQGEEFSFHVEMETAENVRRGMNEADARRAALIRFGGTQRFREEARDARSSCTRQSRPRHTLRFPPPAPGAWIRRRRHRHARHRDRRRRRHRHHRLRRSPPRSPVRQTCAACSGRLRHRWHRHPGDLDSPVTYFHFAKSARSFTALGEYFTSRRVQHSPMATRA